MALINISFSVLLFGSCGYAWIRGGREGKALCLLLLSAALGTPAAISLLRPYFGLPLVTFVVDLVLLVALGSIALRTDRFWPLWILAFHFLSVMTFVAWWLAPGMAGIVYEDSAAFWSIPALGVLFLGPFLDRAAARKRGSPRSSP